MPAVRSSRRGRVGLCGTTVGLALWLGCFCAIGAAVGADVVARPLPVPQSGRPGFLRLTPQQTGIGFTNQLAESRYLTNQIYLNGSGVAIGDIDGDGLPDLYFCGLDVPNALYRNLGGWRFTDITASAGVACAGQASTGALLVDIDGDGDLDLLVNGVGVGTRLFLNDGRGRFP
jgi:enediyne biosynthesis protein E4